MRKSSGYGVVVEQRQSMHDHSIWRHFRWHWVSKALPTGETRRREEFKFWLQR